MTEGKSARQWNDDMVTRATEAFAEHEMELLGPGHWRLQAPNHTCHWTEIVVMGGNAALSVWGDIDSCTFAYCSGAKSPEAVVAWMANADVGYYGHQKAVIGMGRDGGADEYKAEVAIHELHERLVNAEEEFGDEWDIPRTIRSSSGEYKLSPKIEYTDAIEDAIQAFENDYHHMAIKHQLLEDLQHVDQDAWEWVGDIGKVTSCRVIYALMAIRRLWELIQAADVAAAGEEKTP